MPLELITKPVLQTIGKYELFEMIAEGGMGTVYKARDTSTGDTVAIKVVPPQVAKNVVLMKRFEQEYIVASALDHPNIVRALDYNGDGPSPYLVMEFVNGESLGHRIERDGKIPEAEAIRIIAQVAQALHKAHKQGLVHRDVKPDNVLVTVDGCVKLADLGLVKELETDLNLTRTGRGLGTPHFMAPEQFRNAKNADARCDIYSLAATLYNMITGELPFKSNGPLEAWMKKINNELTPASELVPNLSERTDWALRRAMSLDKENRPASCREFIEDLTGHSTRKLTPSAELVVQDAWYMYYTDEDGVTHTVRGTLQGIRRSLKEGVLGDASNIRAGRTKDGPFDPLKNHPEFRDLVMTLQTVTPAQLTKPVLACRSSARAETPIGSAGRVTPMEQLRPSQPKVALNGDRPKTINSAPQVSDGWMAPHIPLTTTSRDFSWLTLMTLLFSIAALAAAGRFLLPYLTR